MVHREPAHEGHHLDVGLSIYEKNGLAGRIVRVVSLLAVLLPEKAAGKEL